MRLFIILPWAVLGMIFSLPVHLYFKSLAKKDQKKAWQKSFRYIRGYFKSLIFLAGTKVEVRGRENIPDDTAVLYVGNHRSYFDIIVSQTLAKGPIGFVAKKEFLKYPLLNLYMTDMGCLFLDRDNVKEGLKSINQGIQFMKEGLSLGLFPEGTRNHGDTLLPFKEGGYRMAEKSKSPIVLMALTGFDRIFEANKFHFIWKRKVIIEFAKPVYPAELAPAERKEYYASIPEQLEAMLASHKQEING